MSLKDDYAVVVDIKKNKVVYEGRYEQAVQIAMDNDDFAISRKRPTANDNINYR